MSIPCLFSSIEYLQGLSNIGEICQHPNLPVAVLQRKIPGTCYVDGIGPWPYRWISSNSDIEIFREGFNQLVTLSIIAQPGWVPPSEIKAKMSIRPFKEHYVFNPAKPTPVLSKRSMQRLKEAESRGVFEMVSSLEEQLVIADLYEELKLRRHLVGGFFDMPRQHFRAIANLPGSVFFRVRDAQGIGVMACGVFIGEFLQILHFVPTEYGLKWNASYLMMHSLQNYARNNGFLLLTGGLPTGGTKGLSIFKNRWSNMFLPVYMLCIVNNEKVVNKLTKQLNFSSNYFPAYRYAA